MRDVVNVTLKWGTRYGPEFVNRLEYGVRRHLSLDHRFVCSTNDPAGIGSRVDTYQIPEIDLPPDAMQNG